MVARNLLVTHRHAPHNTFIVGQKLAVYPCSREFDTDPIAVQVVIIDETKDFIVLESHTELCSIPPSLTLPYLGQEYFLVGFSALTQSTSPIAVSRGIISSVNVDNLGHILGSSGTNPGDSGGGIFDVSSSALLGVNVGTDQIRLNMTMMLQDVHNTFTTCSAPRAHIIPSNVFRFAPTQLSSQEQEATR